MLRPLSLRPLLIAVPAAALLLSGAASAQTTPNPDTANPPLMTAPRPDDQSTTDPVASPPGVSGEAPSREVQNPAAPANSAPVAALPPGAIDPQQARSLVGAELRTADGQPGGRIVDFTLAGDKIGNVVVAPNEVLGVGSKLVTVPVGALANGAEGLTLSMDQAELTKAPAFAYGSEPTLTRAGQR